MKSWVPLLVAFAVAQARADSVVFTETYSERLVNDPSVGGYYVDFSDVNTVQAKVFFMGEVDTTTFDGSTAFFVNVGDIAVANNVLGDDPKYRPGRKSAVFAYADPNSTLSYTVALSWSATTLTAKVTFHNYDVLDLYDLVDGSAPPYSAGPIEIQISLANYTFDGVTATIPAQDTKRRVRDGVGEVFVLNHATATAAAHDPNNPYFNAQGTYNGLFLGETNSADPANSGYVRLALTDSGAYSGKVWLRGGAWPLTGQFARQGDGSIISATTVNQGRAGSLGVSLALNTATLPLSITGSVSNDLAWNSELAANQTIYDSATAPPGAYNVALAPADTNSAVGPGGYSYGRATISAKGAAILTVNLADGSTAAVSFAGDVAQDGSFAYYFPLDKGQGVLLGWGKMGISSAPTWVKEPMNAKFYPDGFVGQFPGPFPVATALYQAPKRGSNSLDSTAVALTFRGAGLAGVTNFPFSYDPVKDMFTASAANPNAIVLHLNPANGFFSGSFNPGGGKIAFSGAFLPDIGQGFGFFKNGDQTGAVTLTTP